MNFLLMSHSSTRRSASRVSWFSAIALALLLHGMSFAGGLAPPTADNPVHVSTSTMKMGSVTWQISETSSGRVLDRGSREARMSDFQVIGRGTDGYLEQRLPLSAGFYLKLNSGREKKPFVGFGMAAGRDDRQTFCWEWFTVDAPNHATKIQESGKLNFRSEMIGKNWEIAETRFLTDVSMRVIDWQQRGLPGKNKATWRVDIMKDSSIQWPTLVGNTVMTPSEAVVYLRNHPRGQMSMWENLVKTASETTAVKNK